MTRPIAVLGAGAWGTALAMHLGRQQQPVQLWGRNADQIHMMQSTRYNPHYLSQYALPKTIHCTTHLAEALSSVEVVLIAVSSHQVKNILHQIRPYLMDTITLVCAAKGLEPATLNLMPELIETHCPGQPYAILSGPSFAHEVAQGFPTAITLASKDEQIAKTLQQQFHSPDFRVYISHDVIGVALGGTMKNLLAIAVGIADGLGYSANTRSALLTRGLAEMQRLGIILGANPMTFMGLSGVGDLTLTCLNDQSRNRRLGLALGQGQTLENAQQTLGALSEGLHNSQAIVQLGKKHDVTLPICEMVYAILYKGLNPTAASRYLLERGATYDIQ